MRWTIVAAAGVAAAASWAVVALRPPAREPTETRGEDRDLVRSLTPASILRTDAVLRWTPAGEGARYTVVVSRLDLTPLYRAEGLEAPELKVPTSALAGAAPGEQILWRVEASLRDGREVDSVSFVTRVE